MRRALIQLDKRNIHSSCGGEVNDDVFRRRDGAPNHGMALLALGLVAAPAMPNMTVLWSSARSRSKFRSLRAELRCRHQA